MKKWKILVDCVLLCCLLSLVACRFDPFGLYGDSDDNAATAVATAIAGFTPAQVQQIVEDIKNGRADLPVSLAVPAYSFYRFDYSNAAGGHRGSTILSYDQAVGSAPYGIETTSRVLIFEAMKARAGYSFDFFAFSDSLAKDRIGPVINAIATKFSDTEFLLNSSQNIGSATLVAQAVNDLVGTLPLPAPADFVPVAIASPAVDLNLKPDFSDLPVTTLTTLFLNEDLHAMYASMTVVGLANYSLFTSNVPAVSQPRPSFRLHKTDAEHDITRDYLVSLAPIGATGSVIINPASPPAVIPGVASAQMAISQSGDGQRIVFTYSGDRGIAQTVTAESEKLVLAFTYRDVFDKGCDSSRDYELGPLAYINRAGPQKFAGESFSFMTPATRLLCVVVADNKAIATFTAEQGVAATADFSVPAGQVATLACYIIPPAAQAVADQARAVLMTAFASETRPLDELENAGWKNACLASNSVEVSYLDKKIMVPTMFKTWFRPVGTYAYQTSLDEFTPQVFRTIAAPASPSIALDTSRYSEEPRYAFSLPIYVAPMVTGITSGVFNTAKTFSIQVTGTRLYEYSLDNGATWNDYSGPVTLSVDGSFQVIARDKSNNFTSAPISLTIDTAAPVAPTITGITSGIYSVGPTFTITGAESGGTIYYSIDNEATSQVYTGPVTISAEGIATCTAWQIDAAGNIGAKTAPVTVTIDAAAPQAPAITGIATGSFKTSQTFTVTASEPGGTLYYSLDNGLTKLTYTEPVTISAEGIATCTAWQVDAAGNAGSRAAAVTVTIDKTAPLAPTITGITSGVFVPGQTFTVTGAEPGGTLYYSLDDGLTSSVYSEAVTISAEGIATCTAWQIDAAGNVGASATPIIVTIDNTQPQVPTITGIASGIFASTQTFTITGAEPGATLYYSLDGGLTSFIYTEPVTIPQGVTATCTAWQVSVTGITSQKTEPVTVTVDNTAPQAPTIAGITTGGTYSGNQAFTVTAAEPGGTLYYSLDDGLTSSVYSEAVTLSVEGIATCTAWQVDAAGNVGARATPVIVTIDNTAPEAPIISGIEPGIYTTSQTFTVDAAETGGTLYYSLDDGLTSALYTGPVTIEPGMVATCTAWQIDAAANTGQKAEAISLSVLKVTLTSLQPANGVAETTVNSVQISGTGFVSGIVPLLIRSNQPPVEGSNVVVNNSTSLTCSFNLTGVAVGACDISLFYGDTEVASGTGMFTVQPKSWRKSLGGLADESDVYCVNAIEGNGVVIAGTTNSYLDEIPSTTPGTLAESDIWIARLDEAGEVLWSRRIGGSGSDRCSGLIAIGDGYILAGDTTSIDGDMNFNQNNGQRAVLLKTDVNGNPVAPTAGFCPTPAYIPPGVSDARGGIRNTADGGGIMAGVCSDGSYKYAWAVKFTPNLEQTWEIHLTGNGPETLAYDIAQKADGSGYLMCGFTSFPNGSFGASAHSSQSVNDGFVAEISNTGGFVKALRFGGNGTDSCTGVVPMANGDFYVIGTTGSTDGFCPLPANRGTEDVMVFRVPADFATASIPLMMLGGSGVDTGLRGQLAADNGLLFSGRTNSTDGDVSGNHAATSDFWLGKISPAMSLEWQKCFGGTADDYLSSFLTTTDGGYLLSGYGLSTDGDLTDTGHQTGNHDFMIIREAPMSTSSAPPTN